MRPAEFGLLQPGEAPRATAIREVREESGHWTRVIRWLEDSPLDRETNAPMVRWFLLELAEETAEWPAENRQRVWLHLAEAEQRATFQETRTLLARAAGDLGFLKG